MCIRDRSHTVHIPTPLRQYTDKLDTVQVAGTTVGDLLAQLTTTYPELKKHLYNAQGKLRHFVIIYVNDEDIRYLQKEQTALGTSDTISIIPSFFIQAASPANIPARITHRSPPRWASYRANGTTAASTKKLIGTSATCAPARNA